MDIIVYVGENSSITVTPTKIAVFQGSEQVFLDEPLINAVETAIQIFRTQSKKD